MILPEWLLTEETLACRERVHLWPTGNAPELGFCGNPTGSVQKGPEPSGWCRITCMLCLEKGAQGLWPYGDSSEYGISDLARERLQVMRKRHGI